MQDGRNHPRHIEPSERELREMLESREREKDSEWKRKSRKLSVILVGVCLCLAATIALIPDTRRLLGGTPSENPDLAAAKAALKSQTHSVVPSPGTKDELDAFKPKPFEGPQTDDIRFAAQLLNFLRTPEPSASERPASPPSSPVEPAKR